MVEMVYMGKDCFRMGEARFRRPIQMNYQLESSLNSMNVLRWMNVLQEFLG